MVDRRGFIKGAVGVTAMAASGQGLAQSADEGGPRAWQVGAKGDFDTLRLVARERGALGAEQVRVQVHASALAARDLAIATRLVPGGQAADLGAPERGRGPGR